MPTTDPQATSEQESRRVAEQARPEGWEGRGFLRDLVLGQLSLDLIHPFPIRAMELVGSYDGNLAAVLSAHQSIGVPQPLKLFGTVEQKAKYLPRCAAGAISAFALTEPGVGSDPASLATTAERRDDHFVLNGEKLWCTNGTIAELLVVMA